MVVVILPKGHSQFANEALTLTVNGKGGSIGRGLGAVRAGGGPPEGCRHCGEKGWLLGGQLIELGKTGEAFEL